MRYVGGGGPFLRRRGVWMPAQAAGPDPVAPTLDGGTMELEGADLVFEDPVASGVPAPSVTFSLSQDGEDVTEARVGDRAEDASPGAYSARWVAANGIAPDAVREVNLTVAPPFRDWTLDDIPASMKSAGALYDPANAVVGANNQISAVPNSWGGVGLAQATSASQVFRGDRAGFPSFVWPDTQSSRSLIAAGDTPFVWMIFVLQYKAGAETTFSTSAGICSGGTGNPSRVFGNAATANLWTNAGSSWAQAASVNAGAYSATVLPLPISLLEIRNPVPLPGALRLGTVGTNLSWNGPMWKVIGLTAEPDAELKARIQGCLAWDYGIEASLPANHPHRNQRPRIAA